MSVSWPHFTSSKCKIKDFNVSHQKCQPSMHGTNVQELKKSPSICEIHYRNVIQLWRCVKFSYITRRPLKSNHVYRSTLFFINSYNLCHYSFENVLIVILFNQLSPVTSFIRFVRYVIFIHGKLQRRFFFGGRTFYTRVESAYDCISRYKRDIARKKKWWNLKCFLQKKSGTILFF